MSVISALVFCYHILEYDPTFSRGLKIRSMFSSPYSRLSSRYSRIQIYTSKNLPNAVPYTEYPLYSAVSITLQVVAIMASTRPKSPGTPASRNNSKDESIWEKIGTLGRKKKIQQGDYERRSTNSKK